MTRCLMVIVPDRISAFVVKGEVLDRYYNPGNEFDEVHVVVTNDDKPDPVAMQKMVGNAKFYVHNLPDARICFLLTLGWRPSLLRTWGNHSVALARDIKPDLIRCHGARLNAYAAACIKAELGVPYVVSMHINPDEDIRRRSNSIWHKVGTSLMQDIERIGLVNADLVMPVYRSIVPYLQRLGVNNYEVCYNTLNSKYLQKKDNYSLHKPVRLVSVGRQFKEKNPENILKALAHVPGAEMTLVGDGEYHKYLKSLALSLNIINRVRFIASMPNDQVCRLLLDSDIFVTHSEYWEIAKAVLEPLIAGIPVIINKRQGEPVPELTDDICLLVENTVEAYRKALNTLITDDVRRERLGRFAYAHAQENWAPASTEAKFVSIYQKLAKSTQPVF